MSFEFFVARRYLFSHRKQAFIYVISLMSIIGVALGVAALVVVLGVYNGLTTDMRDKILGANAHGIVLSYIPDAFGKNPGLRDEILRTPGVTGATPFIYTEVMLSSGDGVKGLMLRGVDPRTAPGVRAAVSTCCPRLARRPRLASSPASVSSRWPASSRRVCTSMIPLLPL